MSIVAVLLLLAVFGSTVPELALMWPVFLIVPATVGVTEIVTVPLAPLATVPRWQVTFVAPVPVVLVLQVPSVEVTDPKVRLVGRVSVTVTFAALAGPALLATSEYAKGTPTAPVAGAVLTI